MRSLDQWLKYQEQAHPRVIDLGLERLGKVLERLDWRQPEVPVVTIAGTNGKGSVSAYCASILQASGLRAGLFTSPHLRDYRERIRIGGAAVAVDDLIAAFERIEAARGDIGLTFFEYNAIASLLLFDAARLDAWVLEIGLGGRLDAVNVVDPDVAVVVSIGWDHMEFLGSTLDAIGAEKAGIFRANRPAILGSADMPGSVENAARRIAAPLRRLGTEFDFSRDCAAQSWHYVGPRWDLPGLQNPSLFGPKQFANAATAIAALEALDDRVPISPEAIGRGIRSAILPGRFQIIRPDSPSSPTWILDVAHNPAAARVVADNLAAMPSYGRTFAVFGVLADKDAPAIVGEVAHLIDAWWLATTTGPRGSSDRALADRVGDSLRRKFALGGEFPGALAHAMGAARAEDRIIVFGSFQGVGAALDWLESRNLVSASGEPE